MNANHLVASAHYLEQRLGHWMPSILKITSVSCSYFHEVFGTPDFSEKFPRMFNVAVLIACWDATLDGLKS